MIKTIKITETTHKKLTQLGKKGETYDQIILRLTTERVTSKKNIYKQRLALVD